MFKAAEQQYGKIDHVFANAGIGSSTSLLEEDVDDKGNLLPPKLNTINVNLVGVMYTVKFGIHYLRKNPCGGSIVMAASAASFSRFPSADYSGYYLPDNFLMYANGPPPQQRPSTLFSACCTLSSHSSIPNCPSASTQLHHPGQTQQSCHPKSSLWWDKTEFSLQMLSLALLSC